jgi:hypothetical protein
LRGLERYFGLRGLSGARLALSPSWYLAAAILGLHAAAAACLVPTLPGWPGVALAAALAALGVFAAWRCALERRALVLAEQERGTGGHVSRYLVTLPAGGRMLLVTRDMLDAEEFRRLRLWALWGRLPRASVAAAQL